MDQDEMTLGDRRMYEDVMRAAAELRTVALRAQKAGFEIRLAAGADGLPAIQIGKPQSKKKGAFSAVP